LYQYANIQGILFDMILFFKKGNNNFKKSKRPSQLIAYMLLLQQF